VRATSCGVAALAAGLLCGAVPAQAQTVAPPPTPSEKDRPIFKPVGGRIGSFMLYPQIDLTTTFDDNVLADETGKRSDIVVTARPTVRLTSLWQRHKLEMSAYLDQSIHARLTSENELQGGVRLSGYLDVGSFSRFDGAVTFDALAEDRSQVTATRGAARPVRFTRTGASLGYTRQVGDFSLGLQGQATRLDFKDAVAFNGTPIDESFRNSTFLSGTVRASYRIGPGISVLGRAEFDRLTYSNNSFGTPPLDRNSRMMKLEGGVYLELTRLLFGELRAGYLKVWNNDARLPNAKGLSFGGSLTWLPTSLTSFKLTANRSVGEGGSTITAGNLRSEASLTVEHELLRSLVLGAEGRVAKIEPIGPLPDTWEYSGELRATWYLNRNLRLIGRVSHFQRSTRPPFTDFARNQAMLTLRAVF